MVTARDILRLVKFPPIFFFLVIILGFVIVEGYTFLAIQPASPARTVVLVAMEDLEQGTYGFNATDGGPTIHVNKGEFIRLVLVNNGLVTHDVRIEGYDVKTNRVSPGASDYIEFSADTSGTFNYYCTVPGHKELGMQGIFIVE